MYGAKIKEIRRDERESETCGEIGGDPFRTKADSHEGNMTLPYYSRRGWVIVNIPISNIRHLTGSRRERQREGETERVGVCVSEIIMASKNMGQFNLKKKSSYNTKQLK